MKWQDEYKKKLVTAEKAASLVKSGDTVGVSAGCSAPINIINALCKRREELKDVSLFSGVSMYPFEFFKPEFKGHINFTSFFLGPMERLFMNTKGNINPLSYQLSLSDEIAKLLKANLVIMEVTRPDSRGYMSFGPVGVYNNDISAELADTVIVQVNSETPFVHGMQNVIHVNDVDYIVEGDHPLAELPDIPITDVERKIGELIAAKIPDGATIQLGIGGVANAVGYLLEEKKDLGVHTELMTDSMMDLAIKGVITGRKKTFNHGKMVASFAIGSRALYDFIDHNPVCEFCPVSFTNNILNIAKNDNFISISNTLTADLTGQCGSESLGFRMYSGTGGQLDFVRGSILSKGGKSFLALPSTADTKEGRISRIVTKFQPGTVISTPRSDVQYIVTEYGIADLWLKSVSDRVKEMISIAHPDYRDELEKEAIEVGLLD